MINTIENLDPKILSLFSSLNYQINEPIHKEYSKNNIFQFINNNHDCLIKLTFSKYLYDDEIITDIFLQINNHEIVSTENITNSLIDDKSKNHDYDLLMRFCDQNFGATKVGKLLGVEEKKYLNYNIQYVINFFNDLFIPSFKIKKEKENQKIYSWHCDDLIVNLLIDTQNNEYSFQLVSNQENKNKNGSEISLNEKYLIDILNKPGKNLKESFDEFLDITIGVTTIFNILKP